MTESGVEAYKLGRWYDVMPIAIVPEAAVDVPAGPVTFVVESRTLTERHIVESARAQDRLDAIDDAAGVDDGGPSLHVLGTADRLEYLRFDCFENEPHYHYVRNDLQANVVVRLDTFAEGDPTRWTLDRVRQRLPEMLENAGAPELADAARRARPAVEQALVEVERLLAAAS
jgi:hypothetical protein